MNYAQNAQAITTKSADYGHSPHTLVGFALMQNELSTGRLKKADLHG
jgi:hypothetical protein